MNIRKSKGKACSSEEERMEKTEIAKYMMKDSIFKTNPNVWISNKNLFIDWKCIHLVCLMLYKCNAAFPLLMFSNVRFAMSIAWIPVKDDNRRIA